MMGHSDWSKYHKSSANQGKIEWKHSLKGTWLVTNHLRRSAAIPWNPSILPVMGSPVRPSINAEEEETTRRACHPEPCGPTSTAPAVSWRASDPSIHPPFPFFPHGFSPAINAHSSSPGTSLSSVPFLVGPRIESRCVHACMCQILSLACLNLVNPCAQTAELLLPTKILHRATPLRKASQVLDDERSVRCTPASRYCST
jgi:hypothetical protein